MYALNQVIDYLHKKISKVNLNNQKSNTGGILIKTYNGWEEVLERIVMMSFQIIQTQFARNNTTYLIGECGLTYVSMSIGQTTAPIISREPIDIKHQLALGDLIIEGFAYHGFVELIAPIKRHENYIVKAAPKWTELAEIDDSLVKLVIVGSSQERPAEPEKHIHKMHDHLFDPEAPYVKAISNLQQTAWRINTQCLDVLLENQSKFVALAPIEENDAKEQRRRSKTIEWAFITRKAEVLREWDRFYQSFDVDYRGRMYNIEPFLNYQGNDLAKGLLLFAEEKPITEDGRFWLAVHTAASYNQSYNKEDIPVWCEEDYYAHLESEGLDDISVDKMTLNDRALWTINNMDKIKECILDMKAEKP